MPAATGTIHVRCTDTGTWTVHPDDRVRPTSAHASETDAEAAARRHLEQHGGGAIMVHDRYRRTHVIATSSRR